MAHDGTNTKKRVKESKANNKKPTWKAMGDGETRDGSRKAREREKREREHNMGKKAEWREKNWTEKESNTQISAHRHATRPQ